MNYENINLNRKSAFMVHHVLKSSNLIEQDLFKKKHQIKSKFRKKVNNKFVEQNINPLKNSKKNFKFKNSKKGLILKHSDFKSIDKILPTNPVIKTLKRNELESSDFSNSLINKINCIKSSSYEDNFKNKTLLQWMIYPIDTNIFIESYWEQKPLFISKQHTEFSYLLNTPLIDKLLSSNNIQYTKNIDITFYSDGNKEVHNLEGRARPHVVWDYYCNKCSIRLLNPHTFVPNIHKLTSELQEYFGCFVGCNAYLTPPGSQGFAPHYDDIEAFILQIEGQKLWKVYSPRDSKENLPRYSSNDFNDENIGQPIMEILLKEGDVLYLPRGYIHQAITQNEFHSLHITISAYQCNAWVDLLQKVMPQAIEKAWKNDVEFRKGLPFDYLKAAGFARNKKFKKTRNLLKENIKLLICKLNDHVKIDSAVDQLGIRFLYDALPPILTEEEKQCSVFGGGLKMMRHGKVVGFSEFTFSENIEIVLLRSYVSRFVKELIEVGPKKNKKIVYRLYYTTDNSLEYHGEETSFLIIPKHFIKCVQYLFQSFPNFVSISELPYESIEQKTNLIADLWERGIVRTKTSILKNV